MSLTSSSPSMVASGHSRPKARGTTGALALRYVDAARWDRLASGFDGICQEQLHTYAARRWPGVDLEPVEFVSGGEVVGGALVMLQRLPLGLATIALVKWGPILAKETAPNAARTIDEMVAALVDEYADRRGMMVSIMPKVEKGPGNRLEALLAARGFVSGVGVQYPQRYVVDLGVDDDTRLAGFAQKWRYNLRKSMKAGLRFEHAGPEELGRFFTLYRMMSARKMFPDFSAIDTVDALMAMPDGTARPELFFVSKGDETVAGGIIFTRGRTACYLYGATADSALALRAGYFLHWHVITWLRENSTAQFYDLGGTDGFAGLHQFKSGMVGEAGHISPLPPVMNYASHWRARAAGMLAYKAREGLMRGRDRILVLRLNVMRRLRQRVGRAE
ncbi:lipid II:glycine glycyltransferase FemX [Pelagibacterium lacus]|nr:peptidoglycan bridge formation glycyltransferase FemA/FemB family protein [Pelagibacterium lacus]